MLSSETLNATSRQYRLTDYFFYSPYVSAKHFSNTVWRNSRWFTLRSDYDCFFFEIQTLAACLWFFPIMASSQWMDPWTGRPRIRITWELGWVMDMDISATPTRAGWVTPVYSSMHLLRDRIFQKLLHEIFLLKGLKHGYITRWKFTTNPRLGEILSKPLAPSYCFHKGFIFAASEICLW